ncbi:MAG: hypothetical protein P4M14_12720 [Gammaproteobacteria bacterium]|nr:hypothetical protein [Gammaproteobacteria bacterium]
MSTSIKKITAALEVAGIAAGDAQKKISEVMQDIQDAKKKLAAIQESINDNIKEGVLAPNETLRKGKGQALDDVKTHTPTGPRR